MINWNKITILKQKIVTEQDEQAYNELFLVCFPVLARFAYSFINTREKSEEIAADVLIGLWKRRWQLDQVIDLKLYLYKSTKNTALNYLKQQKRDAVYSLEDSKEIWMKATDATPEQLLISAELQQEIQKAIQQLPTKCRLIYKLIKEDGLKYREVAELLQLSTKTVEAQMTIALRRLYEQLRSVMPKPLERANS